MARQHKVIRPGMGGKAARAVQPFAQRVGLRFGRIDADIGRDPGQQLIAAKDQVVIHAPQRRMVGRMALTQAHQPAPPACGQNVTLVNAGEALRHRVHHIGEVERAFLGLLGAQRRHRPRRVGSTACASGVGFGCSSSTSIRA